MLATKAVRWMKSKPCSLSIASLIAQVLAALVLRRKRHADEFHNENKKGFETDLNLGYISSMRSYDGI